MYMSQLKIESVTLTPNPVNVNGKYVISVEVTQSTWERLKKFTWAAVKKFKWNQTADVK